MTRDWVIRPMISEEIGVVVDLLSTVPAADIRFALRNGIAETNGNGNAGYAVVAELAGEIVAAAAVTAEHAFPGAMLANLVVKPGYRRRGIATSMAGALARSLRDSAIADTLTTSIRDDLPIGRSFAERRGFTLASHSIGFRYDVPDDADELASLACLAAQRAHVRVRPTSMDTAADRIADCFRRCRSGLPLRYGQRTFDVEARLREYPPDTIYLLAERLSQHEAHPIAMTVLFPLSDGKPWYTKFTGTDPQFRGRGAARAVKTAALHLAFQAGAPAVTTHNNECNSPILSLNEKLGMNRDVGYWAMTRPLRLGFLLASILDSISRGASGSPTCSPASTSLAGTRLRLRRTRPAHPLSPGRCHHPPRGKSGQESASTARGITRLLGRSP